MSLVFEMEIKFMMMVIVLSKNCETSVPNSNARLSRTDQSTIGPNSENVLECRTWTPIGIGKRGTCRPLERSTCARKTGNTVPET